MALALKLASLQLANPVLVASGTFGYGVEMEDLVDINRLGGIVSKAVSLAPRAGNPVPRVTETPAGMLNAIGLANVGVEHFITDKLPALTALPGAVIVNVAGSQVDEYVAVIDRLEQASGIDAYELNISCPNVKEGGIAFGADPNLVGQVVQACRVAARSRPLFVKLSPNVTDITATARAAEAAGADALSLINTLIGMAIDVRTRRPVLANVTGGLSGPAIKPVGLAMVYRCRAAVRIPLIGIGGIVSTTDILEYLMAGANAIQIGTGIFVDPSFPCRAIDELASWCKQEGITDLQDIVGACHGEGTSHGRDRPSDCACGQGPMLPR